MSHFLDSFKVLPELLPVIIFFFNDTATTEIYTLSLHDALPISKEFFTTEQYEPKLQIDAKVALVKYHPGYDPKQIDDLIESGYKAIIFEGTGLGHIGNTMYNAVKKANEKGLFLGMTSQCIDGRTRMTVYESGRDLMELGITPLEDIIPEVALVKAMWALGNSESVEAMKKLMLKNTASEFTE